MFKVCKEGREEKEAKILLNLKKKEKRTMVLLLVGWELGRLSHQ